MWFLYWMAIGAVITILFWLFFVLILDDSWRKLRCAIVCSIPLTIIGFFVVKNHYEEDVYKRYLIYRDNTEHFTPIYDKHKKIVEYISNDYLIDEHVNIQRVKIPDGWTREVFLYWDDFEIKSAYTPTSEINYIVIDGVKPSFRRITHYIDNNVPEYVRLLLPEECYKVKNHNISGNIYLPSPLSVKEYRVFPKE